MNVKSPPFTAIAAIALLTGCRSGRDAECTDAARLREFLAKNYRGYVNALRLEIKAVADIRTAAPRITAESAETTSERLRSRVLNPKHTYKYLRDQLSAWSLSGGAEQCRRRAVSHLKTRELALLRFTTLLTSIRDAVSQNASLIPSQTRELTEAAETHPPAEDRLAAIVDDLSSLCGKPRSGSRRGGVLVKLTDR